MNDSLERPGPADRVLAAADRLFYEQGYLATGVAELMKEAEVAKASFYYHFASKTDLVVAYLEQRSSDWFASLVRAVEGHAAPSDRVRALFDFLESWLVGTGFRGCAFLNIIPEFPDPQSRPRFVVRKAKQALREYVAALCAAAGQPDAGDEVFLLVEGATAQSAAMTDAWPVRAARRAALQRLRIP